MPAAALRLPQELLACLKQLLLVDRSWLPALEGFSIYIRPFAFASCEWPPLGWTGCDVASACEAAGAVVPGRGSASCCGMPIAGPRVILADDLQRARWAWPSRGAPCYPPCLCHPTWLPIVHTFGRPLCAAGVLGVAKPGRTTLSILLSPVGPYFPTGLKPISLFVDEHHRWAASDSSSPAVCFGCCTAHPPLPAACGSLRCFGSFLARPRTRVLV